eukprot:7367238-Pyramimonas_sp.AAC.1
MFVQRALAYYADPLSRWTKSRVARRIDRALACAGDVYIGLSDIFSPLGPVLLDALRALEPVAGF